MHRTIKKGGKQFNSQIAHRHSLSFTDGINQREREEKTKARERRREDWKDFSVRAFSD